MSCPFWPTATAVSCPSPIKTVKQRYGTLRNKYGFIPRDKLDELLDEAMVKQILDEIARSKYREGQLQIDHFEPEKVYKRIHKDYKVILAILIDISWEEMVVEFSRFGNLNDLKLPFNKEQLMQVDPRLIDTQFSKTQYSFNMDILKEGHAWGVDTVLPFVENEIIGKGGFADVYRIKIYPTYDHLTLPKCGYWPAVPKLKRNTYARKQLHERDRADNFRLEKFANHQLHQKPHPNLLPLLAFYNHGGYCNLIFPLADGDLHSYFRKRGCPRNDSERLKFIEAISELTPALGVIHNVKSDHERDAGGTEIYGYHRDLKPPNILFMRIPIDEESRRPGGAPEYRDFFMIADFGLTRFRRSNPNVSSGVPFEFGISTYRAPECEGPGKVGRAGDIWSLGCIFSEVITFCLLGFIDGVEKFMKRRLTADDRDLFHDGKKVKSEVLSWFDILVGLNREDTFVCEFIDLIKEMLHENPKCRPNIGQVERTLKAIIRKEQSKLGISIGMEVTTIAKTSLDNSGAPSVSLTRTKNSWVEYGGWVADAVLKNFTKTSETLTPHDSDNNLLRRRSVSHERIGPQPMLTRPRSASDLGALINPPDANTPSRHQTLRVECSTSDQPVDMVRGGSQGSYGNTARQVPNHPGDDTHHGRSNHQFHPHTPVNTSAKFPFETLTPRRPSLAGSTKSLRDLSKALKILSGFDTMFLVDDSSCVHTNVWKDIRRGLETFVNHAVVYDNDGVDLAFVHTGNQYPRITSPDEFMTRFDSESVSGGGSSLSLSLDRHLAAYKKKYQYQAQQQKFQKPLNLIVWTSGDTGDVDDFAEIVIEYAKEFQDMGAPKKQLGIQFVLVHSQPGDQQRFQDLDDFSLRKPHMHIRDIVDTTAYNPSTDEDNPDIILKVLCGAVNRRLDNLPISSDEYSHSPTLDPLNLVSTPVFYSSETPAQSDGSYTAPVPVQISASAPAIQGAFHNEDTDDHDDDGDEAGLGIHTWPCIPTIRTTSPTADEENLKPNRREAEPPKTFEVWGSPPASMWTYSNPYPKAVGVVSLACVVLYFVGLYYRPTTYSHTPPG